MSVELLYSQGDDLTVVNAARVSLNKISNSLKWDDIRLINYLAKNNHWTPFSHPHISFRIKAPLFVARQWFKSTVGTTRNEMSRRYVDSTPEFHRVNEWRKRPEKSIKQGSGDALGRLKSPIATFLKGTAQVVSLGVYKALLWLNVAPEQARMVLPQSMMVEWIETGSLAFWARFYQLRADSHAQKEIQEYAHVISGYVESKFPVSWKALTAVQ
jgi:thymidylate synthase (FAD)